MAALEVPHLIGLPYTQANCAQVVRMALAEFVSPAAAAALPVTPQEGAQALRGICEGQTSWESLGATEDLLDAPGRVVFTREPGRGPGLALTLGLGWLLTSAPERGSYSTTWSRVTGSLEGVYEWRA